ncbi:MAG: site-specific integrase [Dissulfurispiraceae bacterium]
MIDKGVIENKNQDVAEYRQRLTQAADKLGLNFAFSTRAHYGTPRQLQLFRLAEELDQFQARFTEQQALSISPDDISAFLEECTEGLSRSTRHLRYAQIKAFFNYIIDATVLNIKSPCSAASLSKTFKLAQHRPSKILDKETVDEIISSPEASEIA